MAKGDIKRRREIERLSASLPSLTPAQEWEMQSKCGTAWLGAKKGWCDVCGREFDHELWDSKKKVMVCPKCGTEVSRKKAPTKRKETSKYYTHIVTTAGEWQVIRTFLCRRESRRAEWFGNEILNPSEATLYVTEVFQKFIKPDTVPMIIGLGLRGMSYYSDLWKWDSGWKIRRYQTAYSVWGWIASGQKLLPELRMRGLKRLTEGASPYEQVERVFSNYQSEVMLKAGAVKLFEKYCSRDDYKIRHNWESIRIVLRHKYHRRVRDWGMWFDMMDMLHENGKDRHNPHYICPENLRRAHDEQMAIRERRREKARQEKARLDAIRLADKLNEDGKMNKEYQAKMGAMLGVMVISGDVELKPLQTIRDFFEEGMTLNHCVFSNGYYRHKDCLIIGAKVAGKRTETIEIDTKEWKVVQCRGKYNQPSAYHDKILNLMKNNMDKFRRAAQ